MSGVGAGAHGKVSLELPNKILRTVKPKQPRDYQDQVARATAAATAIAAPGGDRGELGEVGFIAAADLPFEFMLNALRLNDGFSSDCYQARTGLALNEVDTQLRHAQGRGLIEPMHNGWRPTELGRRFLNDLQAGFLA